MLFAARCYRRKAGMKAADFIDYVASAAGVEKTAAKKAVEAVFAGIVDAAKKGEEVNLPGFGKFKVKDSPARQGRNPATGETIEIAASRKLGFTPAKQGKGALSGGRAIATGIGNGPCRDSRNAKESTSRSALRTAAI